MHGGYKMPARQSHGRKRYGGALTLCLAMMLITSCVHRSDEPAASPNSACLIFEPIYLGEPDIAAISADLARKLAAHNLVWRDLCDA